MKTVEAGAEISANNKPIPENPLDTTSFLRVNQIIKILSISRSHWWQGVKDGRFPLGIKLSPKIVVWKTADIRALIDKACSASEQ